MPATPQNPEEHRLRALHHLRAAIEQEAALNLKTAAWHAAEAAAACWAAVAAYENLSPAA